MDKNVSPSYRYKIANDALERAKGLSGKAYREAMDEYHRQLGNAAIEEDISNMANAVREGEAARKEAMAKASKSQALQAMVSNEDRKKNSKVKKAAQDFVSNWKLGAKSIKDIFK